MNYHYILDWFFHERVEQFAKHAFYNVLGAEWHWNRYDFAVLQNDMHTYVLAKIKHEPGVCNLSDTAVEAIKRC